MDKGSNISFPLDSGSTVYNGSGISVGGKASTDILHAAGYITKWALGEYADIIPVSVGGSATTYMCDHYWVNYDNTQNTLLVGGRTAYGSSAGLAYFNSTSGSGYANALVGFRCLTLIS